MDPLLSVREARYRLMDHFRPVEDESVLLPAAIGRVLSQNILAKFPFPPFPNSSMDGFAVRSADVTSASSEHPVSVPVIGDIPAGTSPEFTLGSGQAARIMTGAHLPPGADSVVPVEDTDFNGRGSGRPVPERVAIYKGSKPGDNIRPVGQDMQAGEQVLPAGLRLRPQDVGFLSMLGVTQVPVYRRPRIAVFSSGDEIVSLGQPLSPGKIYDANGIMLLSAIESTGAEAIDLGVFPDQAEAVVAGLERAVESHVDLIISSAGVSVGAFDFVRTVIEEYGRLEFWRVNVRPGKPLAFGYFQNIPLLGLPGNPVSAFVGFELFVRPVLSRLSGVPDEERPVQRVKMLEPIESDGRESYLRAEVQNQDGHWVAHLTGHQGSGNLRSLVQANALLMIPSGVKSVPAGAEVEAWLLGSIKVTTTAERSVPKS